MLSQDEKNSIMKWVSETHPNIVPILMKMNAYASPFEEYKLAQNVLGSRSSLEWWNSLDLVEDSVLSVIHRLLTAVASSSGVERIFSTFGLVQSKLRNKLGTDKAAKLVFLFKEYNEK